MRSAAAKALLAVAVLGVASACGDNDTSTDTDPDASNPAGTGQVASCVVGQWRTTGVTATDDNGGEVDGRLSGGAGVAVDIDEDGRTTLDFAGMRAVEFAVQVAGVDVSGTFGYGGEVTGAISTGTDASAQPTLSADPGATPTPGGSAPATVTPGTTTVPPVPPLTATPVPTLTVDPAAAGALTPSPTGVPTPTDGAGQPSAGTWEPVGEADWDALRVTLDLTAPTQARLLDNAKVGEYATDLMGQTDGVVDVDPLLGEGSYRCDGDRLTLAPEPDDDGMTWTLERA